jgi:hypothetical protein
VRHRLGLPVGEHPRPEPPSSPWALLRRIRHPHFLRVVLGLIRCDYLDPALAWTGVGDSGRGCTLSPVGYEQLTRPKSYHLKTKI